jgi:DNA-binding HxlR family transcriptional regulator
MIYLYDRKYNCNIEVIVDVIGGKWKMLILWNLKDGIKRFNELRRLIPGSTQKMLTAQLRELERDGIVSRKVYPQVPPKVEYSLTKYGQTLKPYIELSCSLGNEHVKHMQRQRGSGKAPAGLSVEKLLAQTS